MYKLLIADDELEIRNGLSHYFPWNEIGFEVVSQVSNGLEVIQYLSEHTVDVILSDIRMPIMSGIDMAKELYYQKSPIKIIFLSGYKEFEYAQAALNFGVKNYILKPTKYNELVNVFTMIKGELDQEKQSVSPMPFITDRTVNQTEETFESDKIIVKIKNYVWENFQDATLEGASQMVHMNPNYISKYFKDKTGENFSDFVVGVRMKKAAELIKEMNHKIYEISEAVGYSNSKNFTRTFRKYFGKSPREFMKGSI
ncbi:response regulator transcription factor [Neobacillus sp. M.A.Huq-85]|nr:response regulator [Neobacillus cucumis]